MTQDYEAIDAVDCARYACESAPRPARSRFWVWTPASVVGTFNEDVPILFGKQDGIEALLTAIRRRLPIRRI